MQTANEADKVLLGKRPQQLELRQLLPRWKLTEKIAAWKTLSTIVLPKPYPH